MCDYEFCPKCFEEAHRGMSCEQYRDSEVKRKKFLNEAEKE